jgi:hypothetical protein
MILINVRRKNENRIEMKYIVEEVLEREIESTSMPRGC